MIDKDDKAVDLFLNGKFKKMRDDLGIGSHLQKMESSVMAMPESMVSGYDNRPGNLRFKKNKPNARRMSQIMDQE